MNKKLPETLIKQQEEARQKTLKTIKNAIDTLKSEGAIVSKKVLIELSGYSASTFSKPHVKELLEKNEVCQFKKRSVVSSTNNTSDRLVRKNKLLENKCRKLEDELLNKDIRISKLENDLGDEKEQTKKLLGKLHEIMRKAESKGIDIL
ncbi:hypothetical protein [Bacillus wiedmannii]|uniref:hypothetical protein n=1 Tax=Bacillus wiedmannii TaxID=1890302 RepID=UPI00355616DA